MSLDTLKLAHSLQRYEFSQAQAEGLAEELRLAITEDVATKADIEAVRRDMADMRTELKGDIDALRKETKSEFALAREEMRALEDRVTLRLIKWIVGSAVGVTAALGGLMLRLLP
jgi:hypothetical protein